MVKDMQYYTSTVGGGATKLLYSDWISATRLEQISTPAPCPSGVPSPMLLEAPPLERKKLRDQP